MKFCHCHIMYLIYLLTYHPSCLIWIKIVPSSHPTYRDSEPRFKPLLLQEFVELLSVNNPSVVARQQKESSHWIHDLHVLLLRFFRPRPQECFNSITSCCYSWRPVIFFFYSSNKADESVTVLVNRYLSGVPQFWSTDTRAERRDCFRLSWRLVKFKGWCLPEPLEIYALTRPS